MWLLLAQTDLPIGGSGWAASGLIGLVLSWLLLVHLPRQDKRNDDKEAAFMTQMKEKDAAHNETIKMIMVANKEALQTVVEHCKEELDKIAHIVVSK